MGKSKCIVLSKSPAHFRIECGCDKYIHELRAGENGEPVFDTFLRNQPQADEPAPGKGKGKKPKQQGWGFFTTDVADDDNGEGGD